MFGEDSAARERTEEDLTPKSEQAEVKEEQEEPDEEVPSVQLRSPDRFYRTIWLEHDPNAPPHEDPLTQVRMSCGLCEPISRH